MTQNKETRMRIKIEELDRAGHYQVEAKRLSDGKTIVFSQDEIEAEIPLIPNSRILHSLAWARLKAGRRLAERQPDSVWG